MDANSNNTMYITYVEKHGAFLKIWGQIDKAYPITIENYLAELKPQFDQGLYTLSAASIQVGLMCCAKYRDDLYYRARVTNISALCQNFVEVHFVDYGNKDILPISALRSGVELSYVLVTIPVQARDFILANVTHVGASWENRTIAVISEEIRYMNLHFTVVQQINPYLTIIKLFKNNEDYALSLFNRGFVLCMSSGSQNMILQNINSTPAHSIHSPMSHQSASIPPPVPPGLQTHQMTLQAASQPQQPIQTTTTLLTYKGYTINPGTDHNVYVSYVSDGPCHFSVQLQKLEEHLAKLMRELNQMELQPLEEHPLPGTVCLAKCVEDDNICRAVITSMSNNEAKVFYVDFGNTEVVPNERLFQIPLKFVIMKVMSTRYSLAGLENTTVTLEMKCAFKEFVSDKLLTMHSLAPPTKYALPLCILWDSNKNNALDVMKKVALLAYPEVISITRGFCQEVIVSYVYSCSHFYVQLKSKEEELRKLMEQLQIECPNARPMNLSQVKEGLPCCALFDTDGQWYRGEIISNEGDIVKVRYVDYGNEELVKVSNLRVPMGDIVTALRPQALECCLNGYQNMADDVERDTILEELILEKEFTMRVIEMQSSRALVDLIDNSRYNVGSLLLERLALARSQVSPLLIQDSYQIELRKRQSPNAVNNKYERSSSRDIINEEESDRGISRKNLNNQRNNDSRNRDMFRQDSNRTESRNKQDDWNNGEASPEHNNKKQESWRQERPRREKNESGEGWNAKTDEWNGATEDRWSNNKRQDSWRQSKPRRDESVPSDEWNGTKQEGSQWGSNKKQESWRQERPPRRKRDDEHCDRDAANDEWGDSTQEHGDWGNKKQDSWQQDKPRRRDRDDGSDGGGDRFKNEGFKKEWRGGGGGGDRDFNKNKRDSYKKESWGDNTDNSEKGGGRNYNQGRKNNFKQDSWGDNSSEWNQKSHNEKDGSGNWEGRKRNDSGKPYKSEWKSEKITKKVEDPADSNDVYTYPEVSGKCEEVSISWFRDPSYFYCQLKQSQEEFRKLVEEIQLYYCKINNESLPVGTPAIAQYSDDKVLYRAYISEMRGSQYYVYFVDFGNFALADKVWPIEKKFMLLPGQALYCSLNGLISVEENGVWPESGTFTSYFDKESFMCTFVSSENNSHFVELVHDNQSISETLVQAGLAKYVESEIFDPSILVGQQIHVTLDDIQGLDSFNVTLPNGVQVLCTLHNLQNATQTFEDTLKQYLGFIVIMYVDNVLEEKTEVTLYDTSGVKINIIEPDEEAYPTIEQLCPLPVLSSTVCGWVSFVVANENKLFIQPTEHSETLTDLLDRLFNHYDTTTLEEPLQPEIGQHYAVHSTDGNWYRGAVLNVEEDNATLLYIDYGNTETVSNSELRELTEEFKELHMLALEVTSSNIDESFAEQEVTATVWFGESCWEAEIQKASDTTEIVAVGETENVESVVQEAEIAETQPDQVLQPVGELDAVGVPVCLSHFDSPNEFYLQLLEAVETIENLQGTLQEEVEGYPDLENPGAGILCAAQYSVDQQWYRAQILDADGEITSIRFVDYGNTDAITTHIKTLPPDMLALEQYARRCSLLIKPIEEEWSTAACERFEALTQTEMLSVEIIHQDEKTTYVQLYADGQDVTEILLQEGLAVKLELEVESSCTGYISNLNSPSEFWIQLENSVADLEWIAEQLMSATNFPELEDLTPGSLCAALYTDDEMWYRARILSNTIAGIEVLFIDYGNSCTCIGLRQLPEDLIMLPPLAQKCSLQKPPGILQWSSQATDEFKNISADGVTVFNIDKLSTGETLIVKLLLNSEDVSEKLLPITESAYITHIDSIHAFWLQKLADGPKSDEIAENLANASEFPMCETVKVGDIVAALQVEDETWYRAQILNVNDNEYEVLFIDYGNVSVTSEIRTLSDDLKHSPLATKHKMEALPGFRWMDDEATEKLVEISNESSTVFEAEFANENVVRLYLDGYDIRSQMDSVCISSVQSSPKKGVATSSIDTSKIVSNLENYEKDAEEKIENVDDSEELQNLETCTESERSNTLVRRSSTPFSERIVPGSICRGDLTEVDAEDNIKGAGSPESRSSTPECDKIVLREEESPKLNTPEKICPTVKENLSSTTVVPEQSSTPEKICPTVEENSSSPTLVSEQPSTPEKISPTVEESSSSTTVVPEQPSTPEKICPAVEENSSSPTLVSEQPSTSEKICPAFEENSNSATVVSEPPITPEKICPTFEENSSSTTVVLEQPATTESSHIVPIVSRTSDEQLVDTDTTSSGTLDENTAPKHDDDETKSENGRSIEDNKSDSNEFDIETNEKDASGDIGSKINQVLPSENLEDRDESIDKLDCNDISRSGDTELNI